MQSFLSQLPLYLGHANSSTRLWLRANTRALTVTADLLHSLTVLSPSADAEIQAQFAATLVAFLKIYRDYPAQVDNQSARLALSLISSSQLLLEMIATRRSTKLNNIHSNTQLNVIILIEAIKAAIRIFLLRKKALSGKILTAPDQLLPEASPPPVCTCGMSDVPGMNNVAIKKGIRSGRRIIKVRDTLSKRPRHQSPNMTNDVIEGLEPIPNALREHKPTEDPILDALFTIAYERRANWIVRMFMSDAECKACEDSETEQTIRRPSLQETIEGIQTSYAALKSGELAAEILYICRPMLHLILIRKFGWFSWKAWCSALLVDLASRIAMVPTTNETEADERRRRMAQLLLYIGRSPLFDLILRQLIKRMTSPLRKIPLVGGITSSAIEWVTLLQQYWFYTSGS